MRRRMGPHASFLPVTGFLLLGGDSLLYKPFHIMISRLSGSGIRRLLLFQPLPRYSTTAAAAEPPPQTNFLSEFLINSLGFSREEALTTTRKVPLRKYTRNDPNLVLYFFQTLGLSKTQIKTMVSSRPTLLTRNVCKTLQPKVEILQEIGIRGSDLIRILMKFNSIWDSGPIRPRIVYLRNLLGSDENTVKAIKRYVFLISHHGPKDLAKLVQSLQKIGLSNEHVSRLIIERPRCITVDPRRFEDISLMLENDFGISCASKKFYRGIVAFSSSNKSKLDMKFGVFRDFGWSEETIRSMIWKFPCVLNISTEKIRKFWNFFSKELGYPPDYLASRPVIFSHDFERRVKPRSEVLKILNEKFNKRKFPSLFTLLSMPEGKFVNNFLLLYENEIPDVLDSYFKIVGRMKSGKLLFDFTQLFLFLAFSPWFLTR